MALGDRLPEGFEDLGLDAAKVRFKGLLGVFQVLSYNGVEDGLMLRTDETFGCDEQEAGAVLEVQKVEKIPQNLDLSLMVRQ